MSERLVPEGAVHELLGVSRAPRQVGVNISILNALGRRWLDREDVLRWLDLNAQATESGLVARLRAELEEVSAP